LAEHQAENEDKGVIETLQSIRRWMPRFLASPDKAPSINVPATIEEAERAIEAKEWRVAYSLLLKVRNVITPEEWIKSDRRRVDRHPLNYVAYDFLNPPACPAVVADATASVLADLRF